MRHKSLSRHRFCDRVRRRDFMRIGAVTAAGLGLTDFLRLQGGGAVQPKSRAKSVILLFAGGGASQIDTFDLKPEAPAKYRGLFDPIASVVPGISVCEHLSLTALQLDKMSLIRSVHHTQPEHQQAAHYMLTGWMPSRVITEVRNEHPSLGSVVVNEIGDRPAMPPYVVVRDPATFVNRHHGAAFLGHQNEPFQVQVPFQATDVPPPKGMTLSDGMTVARMQDRRSLVQTIDRRLRRRDEQLQADRDGYDLYKQKAFDILTSPRAATAFDLSREPERVRDRYGRNLLGQGCLLARRLVDAGVRFVTISKGGWDTHKHNFKTMEEELLPQMDRALSALLEDLHDRGLLQSTLVIWNGGEFGRTPIINKDAGRDHWSQVATYGLAGGGIQQGHVVGQSDKHAAFPIDRPVTPEDVWATMYHLLGVDWHRLYKVPEAPEFSTLPRFVPILPHGTPIRELL